MSRKNTKQILADAREIVADRWVAGELEDYAGNVCAMGALSHAAYGRVGYLQHFEKPKFGKAVDVLQSVLPNNLDNCSTRGEREDCIVSFNDTSSQQCVLAAFDAALELANATN